MRSKRRPWWWWEVYWGHLVQWFLLPPNLNSIMLLWCKHVHSTSYCPAFQKVWWGKKPYIKIEAANSTLCQMVVCKWDFQPNVVASQPRPLLKTCQSTYPTSWFRTCAFPAFLYMVNLKNNQISVPWIAGAVVSQFLFCVFWPFICLNFLATLIRQHSCWWPGVECM